jgi:hypothetical protein
MLGAIMELIIFTIPLVLELVAVRVTPFTLFVTVTEYWPSFAAVTPVNFREGVRTPVAPRRVSPSTIACAVPPF